jgi:hypothetical protein
MRDGPACLAKVLGTGRFECGEPRKHCSSHVGEQKAAPAAGHLFSTLA